MSCLNGSMAFTCTIDFNREDIGVDWTKGSENLIEVSYLSLRTQATFAWEKSQANEKASDYEEIGLSINRLNMYYLCDDWLTS